MANEQRPKGILDKKMMAAQARTATNNKPLVYEIFTKVNNAKVKADKVAVLKQYDSPALRQICKAAFDPKIEWDLPEGNPPYKQNEAPTGTEHTTLLDEARKLYIFIKGGNNLISKTRKETLFIQVLEALHKDEAKVLLDIKNRKLAAYYKGLSEPVVKESFNWDDNFMRKQ